MQTETNVDTFRSYGARGIRKEADLSEETRVARKPGIRGTNLNGARVALLESRHAETMANLVQMYGGLPFAVPALRESAIDSPRINQLVAGITRGRFSTVIFQTGVAAQRLFDEADQRGVRDAVAERLSRAQTVVRGPKPAAVLSRYGVKATIKVDEPYTTQQLLRTLATIDVDRKYVALLHYGERNQELSLALRTRGARLAEFLLYEWHLPHDTLPLQGMVRELVAGRVDAIAFTNQMQIRHLTLVADGLGLGDDLGEAMTRKLVVASIGPSCTHRLRQLGIHPRVVPLIPKMRPLIASLSDYFARSSAASLATTRH
jgi:uroporphyrinogen-III synthase